MACPRYNTDKAHPTPGHFRQHGLLSSRKTFVLNDLLGRFGRREPTAGIPWHRCGHQSLDRARPGRRVGFDLCSAAVLAQSRHTQPRTVAQRRANRALRPDRQSAASHPHVAGRAPATPLGLALVGAGIACLFLVQGLPKLAIPLALLSFCLSFAGVSAFLFSTVGVRAMLPAMAGILLLGILAAVGQGSTGRCVRSLLRVVPSCSASSEWM